MLSTTTTTKNSIIRSEFLANKTMKNFISAQFSDIQMRMKRAHKEHEFFAQAHCEEFCRIRQTIVYTVDTYFYIHNVYMIMKNMYPFIGLIC